MAATFCGSPPRDWQELLSASCASSSSARDVRLVCKNGAVDWSSLLLAQWSDVVRSHMADVGAR